MLCLWSWFLEQSSLASRFSHTVIEMRDWSLEDRPPGNRLPSSLYSPIPLFPLLQLQLHRKPPIVIANSELMTIGIEKFQPPCDVFQPNSRAFIFL